jgi:hypothetical protein
VSQRGPYHGHGENPVLLKQIDEPMVLVQQLYPLSAEKQRESFQFHYAASTWKQHRKVIAKLEVTEKGPNPRFIVTKT